MIKTNVMRLLDAAGISYETGVCEVDEKDLSGSHAADQLGVDHDRMYKTLVLKGAKKGYLVCCIPVDEELDLKKAAKASEEKKAEMLRVKDMLDITGYIRGGCSPIGMKKKFPVYIEEMALAYDTIMVSAGQRGVQVTLSPADLKIMWKGNLFLLCRNQSCIIMFVNKGAQQETWTRARTCGKNSINVQKNRLEKQQPLGYNNTMINDMKK